MKNLIYCVLLIGIFFSCIEKKINYSNIDYIEVYSMPFGINTIVAIDQEAVRKTSKPYIINNIEDLKLIKSKIEKLNKSKENYSISHIYLVCDIYFTNRSKITLLYNKGDIQLNNIIYDDSDELIDAILRLKPSSN